jgi:hypothetical protein
VITDEPGRCPDCGMKLLPAAMVDAYEHGDDDRHDGAAGHGDAHAHDAAGGIEWEDDMVEINKITTPANMRWKLIDRTTGAENRCSSSSPAAFSAIASPRLQHRGRHRFATRAHRPGRPYWRRSNGPARTGLCPQSRSSRTPRRQR